MSFSDTDTVTVTITTTSPLALPVLFLKGDEYRALLKWFQVGKSRTFTFQALTGLAAADAVLSLTREHIVSVRVAL